MSENTAKFDFEKAKELLESQGRTRAWVAEQIGIERQSLSLILNGHRNPSRQTWKLLAIVLGVDEVALAKVRRAKAS